MRKARSGFYTEKQKQAVYTNNSLRCFAALRMALQKSGHYTMLQRVRELEETFRNDTNRKEL